ncbi:MAG: right-handed parallel beta-helix repeat-containing protein, partial [Fibrobacteres bacterium]|nr:right-handed parallel beta-helix repeat-containing protein [Fibrobacterota bacterium]
KKDVFIPAGRFIHKKFRIEGVTVRGLGDLSILHAPNPKDAQITLWGKNSVIRDLKSTANTIARDPLWCDNIRAEQADSFLIQNVTIDGCDGAGIMLYIAFNGKVLNNRVSNSLSDGIHTMGGSRNIIIAGNTVRHCGDDHIAVVSYDTTEKEIVKNILVQDNDVADQIWGRGMSVVGGMNVTFRRNRINRCSAAGFIVATEASYTTGRVENILIEENEILNSNYLHPETGHSGIMVSADNQNIRNVLFRNNKLSNTPGQGIRLEGSAIPANIAFVNTTMSNITGTAFVLTTGSNIYCSGTTKDGLAITPPCNGVMNYTVTGSSLTYQSPTTNESNKKISKDYVRLFTSQNPFTSGTIINCALEKSSLVNLFIYDINGRLVSKVFSGMQHKGTKEYFWNVSNINAGVFIVRLQTVEQSISMRINLVK